MANFLEKPGELYGRFRDRTMQPGRLGRGVLRTLARVVPAAARADTRLAEREARIAKLDATTARVTASVAQAFGLPAGTTASELAAYFEAQNKASTVKDPADYAHAPELAVASDGQATNKAT